MMDAKTAHRLDTVSAPCGHKKKNTQTQKETETLKKKKKKNSYAERHSLPEPADSGSEPPMGLGNEQQKGLGLTRQKRWQLAHPEARKAHLAVAAAVRAGRITRQPCQECGHPRTDAHHQNYGEPLSVEWLCRRHHVARHRKPILKSNLPSRKAKP